MDVVLQYSWQLLLAGICVYLLSNINFAIIFSTRFAHKDIRECGSGNPGSTNVVRSFGTKLGVATFVCDMSKGIFASIVGLLFGLYNVPELTAFAPYLMCLCAVLGHIFPVFLKFKGGKGVATSLGFFFVVNPIVTAISLIFAVVIILIWDKVSIFALFHITLQFVWVIIKYLQPNLYALNVSIAVIVVVGLTWAVIILKHRENIARLLTGKENNSGIKKIILGKKKD